ncbi:MAG: peptidase S7 [Firmicutes bacterium]|nr:peptidase S7 [Bacillota bacterium]
MKIKGIARELIDCLVDRSNKLGQGRSIGLLAFIDKQGYISTYSDMVDGGLAGLPFRMMLSAVLNNTTGSLLELINRLPANTAVISTSPGKTGIIISTGGINIFDCPIIKIGIKNKRAVGVGVLYPEKSLFKLASESEKVQLESLSALTMKEERQALRRSTELRLAYLDISAEIPVVDLPIKKYKKNKAAQIDWSLPRLTVKGIERNFAEMLVNKSISIEQGREVAAVGILNKKGYVEQAGELIVGGMGYVPSRLLLSGYADIRDISLREAYTDKIPAEAVIVHTHPGGTGVMHMGDAMAGPGTWGRPIIAIGHDRDGIIKGATVIEFSSKLNILADKYEMIEQKFYQADNPADETRLRKQKYKIAQEFTELCKEIKII